MAVDLFHTLSPNELKKEVARLVIDEKRALPAKAKTFAAIAKLQKFDLLPEIKTPDEIEALIVRGAVELNRGLFGTRGIPALFYARELLRGGLYPGALSALGIGIYLATTSPLAAGMVAQPGFPRISKIAYGCAFCPEGETGALLRCVISDNAKILTQEQIAEIRRTDKNRAKDAEITDFGTLTAALGFDGFLHENVYSEQTELVYVIVNRTVLTFQSTALQTAHQTER